MDGLKTHGVSGSYQKRCDQCLEFAPKVLKLEVQ